VPDQVSTDDADWRRRAEVGQRPRKKAGHEAKANDNVELEAWQIDAMSAETRAAA
jgi:hypothetical protein